ncbi:MAG: PIN domain-containing protein [Pseudomonadota bacterium]|nr:PIN domain-containing protein [Pseudomonadota bacterium]
MIYLDTNVVVWLAAHALEQISQTAQDIIENSDDLCVSPMVVLELKYLLEIERITQKPEPILHYLEKNIGLKICDKPFLDIIEKAKNIPWTRDPFDRIITAQASIDGDILLTRDLKIRENYKHCIW